MAGLNPIAYEPMPYEYEKPLSLGAIDQWARIASDRYSNDEVKPVELDA